MNPYEPLVFLNKALSNAWYVGEVGWTVTRTLYHRILYTMQMIVGVLPKDPRFPFPCLSASNKAVFCPVLCLATKPNHFDPQIQVAAAETGKRSWDWTEWMVEVVQYIKTPTCGALQVLFLERKGQFRSIQVNSYTVDIGNPWSFSFF